MLMKDKVQNLENYHDSCDGFIPVNQKIESLWTDSSTTAKHLVTLQRSQ
jgi:hypothetical protein